MYGALWRIVPGPRWFKVILFLVAFFALVAFLFKIGFPWFVEVTGYSNIGIDS
ncbi:MAG: hypothetical protein SPG61_02275 [Arcanobacterium sp.]|nr:hypothetical protein [Arcanobacterium sp.]